MPNVNCLCENLFFVLNIKVAVLTRDSLDINKKVRIKNNNQICCTSKSKITKLEAQPTCQQTLDIAKLSPYVIH